MFNALTNHLIYLMYSGNKTQNNYFICFTIFGNQKIYKCNYLSLYRMKKTSEIYFPSPKETKYTKIT